VKHRRPHADQRGGGKYGSIARGKRDQDEADERGAHAEHERIGRGVAVGDIADPGLEHRSGELEGEGDESDLAEVEREVLLQHGVDRHDQRLDHVVQHVADADSGEHRDHGPLRAAPGSAPSCLDGHALNSRVFPSAGQNWGKPRFQGKSSFSPRLAADGRALNCGL